MLCVKLELGRNEGLVDVRGVDVDVDVLLLCR